MLSKRLQSRYLAKTWDEIVTRIVDGPLVRQHPVHPPAPGYVNMLAELLHARAFVPAGNTLTFSAKSKSEVASALRPNCSIFENVSEGDAVSLWSKGIGVGTTVTSDGDHPVARLHALQQQWSRLTLEHRPMRGNMFVYPIDGAYVRQFIAAKNSPAKADILPAFNISVGVHSDTELDSEMLHLIASAAWASGDPGIVFLDRVNDDLPLITTQRRIRTVVPCGEQGMFDGEVCTLGAINLNADWLMTDNVLNMSSLEQAVRVAVTFLDNAVDLCSEGKHALAYRRIGLGVMGWADYLQRVRLDYASPQARSLATTLSTVFGAVARDQSSRLATLRGPFPRAHEFTINQRVAAQDDSVLGTQRRMGMDVFMRNVSVTCLAPTGGISLLTGNRGFSIEPFFAEATTISPEAHIGMAAAWQHGVCNSVSKTINLAESATVNDVKACIKLAYANRGIKALSVYRANSRNAQPLPL